MKKIKDFFLGLLGLLMIGKLLGITQEHIMKFMTLLFSVAAVAGAGLVVYLLIKFFIWLSCVFDKTGNPQPQAPKAATEPVAIKWNAPAVSFSASTDKDDYDYGYDHVGLFRPSRTLGPVPPVGTQVFFKEEPDNPYDDEAVKAVWFFNGEERLAGYLYRSDEGIRSMIRDWLAREDEYYAVVINNYDKPRLFIGFNR